MELKHLKTQNNIYKTLVKKKMAKELRNAKKSVKALNILYKVLMLISILALLAGALFVLADGAVINLSFAEGIDWNTCIIVSLITILVSCLSSVIMKGVVVSTLVKDLKHRKGNDLFIRNDMLSYSYYDDHFTGCRVQCSYAVAVSDITRVKYDKDTQLITIEGNNILQALTVNNSKTEHICKGFEFFNAYEGDLMADLQKCIGSHCTFHIA